MYKRLLNPTKESSYFLFGPRGTGKTTWLKSEYKNAIYIDLLDSRNFIDLSGAPERLEKMIPPSFQDWVILDEVQKIPELLNEVHRLIENKRIKFILTGSSARKLKNNNINLLAGRALTYAMYPLTLFELGDDFKIENSLEFGHLPSVFNTSNKKKYLESYVKTYLQEEVKQEGLTRNIGSFTRFLEVASFSQGNVLNTSEVSREASVNRKVAENYFSILEDLMIGFRLPVFSKKSKRRLIDHNKFYFFDTGIYRTLRPHGPFDLPEEILGIALETLLYQEIKAMNDYFQTNYKIYFWRTSDGYEVDFVLYGEKGLIAIEIKRKQKIHEKDLKNLRIFIKDYPIAKMYLLYGGEQRLYDNGVEIIPFVDFLKNIKDVLK